MDIFLTPLVVGLPAIDQSLDSLLIALRSVTPAQLTNLTSLAKIVGLLLALCVGSYECWMMMLGRRVIDVMKLFRIIGLSMCITFSGPICESLALPGQTLENETKGMARAMNKRVAQKEMMVAKLQDKYYQKVRALQDSIESAKRIEALGEDADWMEKITYSISNLGNTIDNFTKRAAIVTETKITEWANLIIRFIGEAIFQIAYYSLLVMQLVFMKLLAIFAPLMFALSIAPPWSSAWSQWISKYLTISLWGFVVYLCVFYADAILLYTLEKDIRAYTALIGQTSIGSWSSIGTLGMQGIGSTCMYFVGMCIGAVLLKSVPEVCSWLIPGGVSSSTAGGAGGAVTSAASSAGNSAMSAGSTAVVAGAAVGGAVGSVAKHTASFAAATAGGAVGGAQSSFNQSSGNTAQKVGAGALGAMTGAAKGASSQVPTPTFIKDIASSYNKGKSSATPKTKE